MIVRCRNFREMMGSYLGDELLVETNHEVLNHLENCPACRGELAARRELLMQMRLAVKGAPGAQSSPTFAFKMKNELREKALRPAIWKSLRIKNFNNSSIFAAAVAACLLMAVLFGAVWFNRSSASPETALKNQPEQPNSNGANPNLPESATAQAVQIALREMMNPAVGDHKNCALHFRLAEKPITLTQAAEKYGRFNKDLDKAVKSSLDKLSSTNLTGEPAAKFEFIQAHSCVFQGRRFAHVIVRRNNKIISLLVTNADSFDGSDSTIATQTVGNLQIAGFGAERHAVFVVSDLTEAENSAIAELLSPVVRRHIEQAEA